MAAPKKVKKMSEAAKIKLAAARKRDPSLATKAGVDKTIKHIQEDAQRHVNIEVVPLDAAARFGQTTRDGYR